MSFIIGDRVQETSTVTGTGVNFNLSGPIAGARSFIAGVGDGNKTYYLISMGNDYEIGIGTVVAGSPNKITRDTVIESSNGGARVNWAAGTKNVVSTVAGQHFDNRTKIISTNYTVLESDRDRILQYNGTGSIFVYLPDASAVQDGFSVTIAVTDSTMVGEVLVVPDGFPVSSQSVLGVTNGSVTVHGQEAMTMQVRNSETDWGGISSFKEIWAAAPGADGIGTFPIVYDNSGTLVQGDHMMKHPAVRVDGAVTSVFFDGHAFEMQHTSTPGSIQVRHKTLAYSSAYSIDNGTLVKAAKSAGSWVTISGLNVARKCVDLILGVDATAAICTMRLISIDTTWARCQIIESD